MKRNLLPIVLVSLALGLSFDLFFYGKVPGISVLLFSISILLGTFYLAAYHHHQPTRALLIIWALILFFAAMVSVRANGLLTFLNIVVVMYLLLLVVKLILLPHNKLQDYNPNQYLSQVFALPFRFVGEFLGASKSIVATQTNITSKKSSVKPIIIGVILSLPFLIVFLLLFSSADLVFKRYIGSLFDFQISPETIFRWLLILFVSSLFIGAYTLMFGRANKSIKSSKDSPSKLLLGITESSIVLSLVSLLFFLFVVIQVTYLFGGHSLVASAGFTYSEYARKGFFELIVVAVITLALLLVLNNSTVRSNVRERKLFLWLSGLLIGEVGIIMLSAFRRLVLYEQAYGFTALRLYSHLFICWLAVIFILLFIRLLKHGQKANQFPFQIFVSVIALLILINFINPDGLIARQNIQRFRSTGKIDTHYLAQLSEDATPIVSTLLNDPDENLQKSVARDLYIRGQTRKAGLNHWQSYNLSRNRSGQILQNNFSKLETNKDHPFSPDYLKDN